MLVSICFVRLFCRYRDILLDELQFLNGSGTEEKIIGKCHTSLFIQYYVKKIQPMRSR